MRATVARIVRRVGIAIGSLVIASLAVGLIAGILLGQSADRNLAIGVITFVLGGLIFTDIVRRERQKVRDR
jgi:uncharacterized membrane protein